MNRRINREENSFSRSRIRKDLAVHKARYNAGTKFAAALLDNKARHDRILNSELNRINSEMRRKCVHIEQQMKNFKQNRNVPEPTIIVERPASPEAMKIQNLRAYNDHSRQKRRFYGLYSHSQPLANEMKGPGYLQPTENSAKNVSTLPTIDAYVAKTKKKINLWEENTTETEFKCIAPPTYPLSEREKYAMKKGLKHHKPLTPNRNELPISHDGIPPEILQIMEQSRGQRLDQGQDVFLTQTTHQIYKGSEEQNATNNMIEEEAKTVTFSISDLSSIQEIPKKKRSLKDEREKSYMENKRKENLVKFEKFRLIQSKGIVTK